MSNRIFFRTIISICVFSAIFCVFFAVNPLTADATIANTCGTRKAPTATLSGVKFTALTQTVDNNSLGVFTISAQNTSTISKTINYNKYSCRCQKHSTVACIDYWPEEIYQSGGGFGKCHFINETITLNPSETKIIEISLSQYQNMLCGRFQMDLSVLKINDVDVTKLMSWSLIDLCRDCTITPPVSVSCTASPNPVNVNQGVIFSSTPSGGNGTYAYSWTGDCTGTSNNCSKSFTSAGTKTATVIVTSGNQTSQPATCPVVVNEPIPDLAVSCVATPSSVNTNQNVLFSSTVSGGVGNNIYSWVGACTGSSSTCAKEFPNAGTQTATVTVTSGNQVKNAHCSVNVIQPPSSIVVSCYATPNPVNTNQSTTFVASALGGVGNFTYEWTGVCTGTSSNCSKSFTSSGTKTATVVATSGGQHSQPVNCSVVVNEPNPNLTVSCSANPSSIQTGQSATFIPTVAGGNNTYTYSWSGACTGTSTNCTDSFNTIGTQTATVTVTSGNQVKNAHCSVNVIQPPSNVVVSCYSTPNPINTNQSTTFIANAMGGVGNYIYEWTGACVGSSPNCSNSYTTAGTKTASVVAISGGQRSPASSCPVIVNQPTENLSVSCYATPNPVNTNQSTTFISAVTGGTGNNTYSWSGDCSGSSQSCSNTFSSQGSKTATVNVTSGNQSQSATCSVNVNQTYVPVGNLTLTKSVRNISNNSSGFSNTAYAVPSDMLLFMITLQANNADVQNVYVRDILPSNLIYSNQLTVACTTNNSNYNNCNNVYTGDITSGINIGTIYAGQTKTITYQTQIASAQNFSFGTTTLTNMVSVNSSTGYTPNASASVIVTRSGVLGASTVSTGLTNNFWLDSFILPMIITLLGIWMWRSGMFFGVEKWLDDKKKVKRSYKAEKELLNKITAIQRSGRI